jgi:site-specific recombinase XerD
MSKNIFPSLSRAIEGFLLHKSASGRSPYTLRNYRPQLIRFANQLDDQPINEITSKQIEAFFRYLREDYHINSICHDKKKLSPKTVKNAWGALSTFWKWVSQEFEIDNPFKVPHIKANTKPIQPISMEELQSLLKACETCNESRPKNRRGFESKRPTRKRDRALILILVDTGVRVSELCNSNVGYLDQETGRLVVTGKGDKTRLVYLGKLTRQAVWQYLGEGSSEKPIDYLQCTQQHLHPSVSLCVAIRKKRRLFSPSLSHHSLQTEILS